MSRAVTPRMRDALAALLRVGSAPLICLEHPWRCVWDADGWEIVPSTANALRRRGLAEAVDSGRIGARRALRDIDAAIAVAAEVRRLAEALPTDHEVRCQLRMMALAGFAMGVAVGAALVFVLGRAG